jgi:ribosome-associated heat shock protein Hsp15
MMSKEDRYKTPDEVRVDRWLWAARFYKSRTLAAKACIGGKVDINGNGAKSHKSVRPGDLIEFTVGDWERKVKVLQLAEKRGPAAVARLLYEDLSPPPPSKTDFLFSPTPSRPKGAGRPTKREGRKLRKLKGD